MSFTTALYASRRILVAAYLMGLVLASVPITLSAATPEEDRCRAAVAMALDTLRQLPSGTPRDEERRKQLLAELEQLVESNRRQGMGRAARQ